MFPIDKNRLQEVISRYDISPFAEQITKQREDIKRIITREDPRLMICAGGCSLTNPSSDRVLLQKHSKLTKHNYTPGYPLYHIARAYPEKPRSTFGWQGMLKEPIIDGVISPDIVEGINQYLEIANFAAQNNIPLATEIIEKFDFIRDAVDPYISIGFLGARNCCDTTLRALLASKPFAIGAKHTQNSLKSGLEAMIAINNGNELMLMSENYQGYSKKNPYVALTLRGFTSRTNYDRQSLYEAIEMLEDAKEKNKIEHGSIIVDCSHANSLKDASRQRKVVQSIMQSIEDDKIRHYLSGIMLEVNDLPGKQSISPTMIPGISVTDECEGFYEFENIVEDDILPRYNQLQYRKAS